MIETKVPKDIRKFKGKAIGPFTFRQVICLVIAIVVDLTVYSFLLRDSNLGTDTVMMILMTCALPILIFIMEPNGMKMEVYLRKVLYKNILFPTKRKNKTDLSVPPKKKTENEIKAINKEYQERIKKEPEWKMYT